MSWPIGRKHTPEAKARMSIAMRGNTNSVGVDHSKNWSPEMREAARQRALNMSMEQRNSISKTLSGRKNPQHSLKMKQKWCDPEFREKLTLHLREISGLSNKPTSLEKILNRYLNKQYPDKEIIPYYSVDSCRYTVDFAIPELKLVFEADGKYWHNKPGVPERDAKRDKIIESCGWTVIRFSQEDLLRFGDEQA